MAKCLGRTEKAAMQRQQGARGVQSRRANGAETTVRAASLVSSGFQLDLCLCFPQEQLPPLPALQFSVEFTPLLVFVHHLETSLVMHLCDLTWSSSQSFPTLSGPAPVYSEPLNPESCHFCPLGLSHLSPPLHHHYLTLVPALDPPSFCLSVSL